MGVYASPTYVAAHGTPVDIQELGASTSEHRFVGWVRDASRHPWHFHLDDGKTFEFIAYQNLTVACNSLALSAFGAIHGIEIVRLPLWLVRQAINSGAMLRVFEEPIPFGYPLHA